MNSVQMEDCQKIELLKTIDWESFQDITVLITGSTGLIGSNLVNAFIHIIRRKKVNINLVLLVRNINKAKDMFPFPEVQIVHYTLGEELQMNEKVDYIVHLSSPTDSRYFADHPVDTMRDNIEGTMALLEYARKNSIKKFIYISTMEVYGFPKKGHMVKEKEIGAFDTMSARNSYPVAKIACETLCHSYYSQHRVPAVVLRMTQTFGPGVRYDDRRVFAEFMRCAIEKRDIELKTAGLTERPYLYTADAVSAIIIAMTKGTSGDVYSVANPETYCSIKEMAELVATEVTGGEISVRIAEEDGHKYGYADTLYMNLDVSKICRLGWEPTTGLYEMFSRMIKSVRKETIFSGESIWNE